MRKTGFSLYRVDVPVLPAPWHPMFWEIDSGWLQVWLYAEGAGQAQNRALGIVAQLPYSVDQRETIQILHPGTPEPPCGTEPAPNSVSDTGLHLRLVGVRTGGDFEAGSSSA